MNEARIKTCARDPRIRLLFVGIALVLRNVWVWIHFRFARAEILRGTPAVPRAASFSGNASLDHRGRTASARSGQNQRARLPNLRTSYVTRVIHTLLKSTEFERGRPVPPVCIGLLSRRTSHKSRVADPGLGREAAAGNLHPATQVAQAQPLGGSGGSINRVGTWPAEQHGYLDGDSLSQQPRPGRTLELCDFPSARYPMRQRSHRNRHPPRDQPTAEEQLDLLAARERGSIFAVRATLLCDRWDETLTQVRQSMARDRRLDWQWNCAGHLLRIERRHRPSTTLSAKWYGTTIYDGCSMTRFGIRPESRPSPRGGVGPPDLK